MENTSRSRYNSEQDLLCKTHKNADFITKIYLVINIMRGSNNTNNNNKIQ